MRQISVLMLLSIAFLFSTVARADLLPDVENVQIDGQVLSWDAQEGATGYNIILNYTYYDTVRDAQSYTLSEPGLYRIVSFNDVGDFGSDYPDEVEYAPGTAESSVGYNYQYPVLLVYKTCKDVGPGDSCIAICPRTYKTQYNQTIYPEYMSGGACSTSDIVEADAFVSRKTYKCTVPTFSGEVVAQAICPIRR